MQAKTPANKNQAFNLDSRLGNEKERRHFKQVISLEDFGNLRDLLIDRFLQKRHLIIFIFS